MICIIIPLFWATQFVLTAGCCKEIFVYDISFWKGTHHVKGCEYYDVIKYLLHSFSKKC